MSKYYCDFYEKLGCMRQNSVIVGELFECVSKKPIIFLFELTKINHKSTITVKYVLLHYSVIEITSGITSEMSRTITSVGEN